jgi:N6-adenosine-specific RNA methylase IME4
MNALVPSKLLSIDTSQFANATPDTWAQAIAATFRMSVDAILMTGRLLVEAKAALPHGSFIAMVDTKLPFHKRTAQMLMAIGEDARLTETNHGSLLPPHWRTLYELTRLDDDTLAARFADGTIRPEMERSEVIQGRLEARRDERLGEMRQLASNPLALPAGPFAAGIADPPWENPDAPIGFNERHYRAKYPTMSPAEIAAMPVGGMFAATAFLALWITRHHLARGSHIVVLTSWGFEANTIQTWDKEWIGLGNGYVRDRTEHIVLATRGQPPAPVASLRPDSLFAQRRSPKHSEKPLLHPQIEKWFPDMSYVELFARGNPRRNWTMWGNQAPDGEVLTIDHDPNESLTNQDHEDLPGTFRSGVGFWAEDAVS